MMRSTPPRIRLAVTQILLLVCATFAAIALPACSDEATPPDENAIRFPEAGPLVGDEGRGAFAIGVANASTQIEELNPDVNWYVYTLAQAEGGLGRGTDFVDGASQGFTRALDDVQLLVDLGVDTYRFEPSWSRIEPNRDDVQEAALEHYDELVDALVAANITPMMCVQHFGMPIWADDPRQPGTCPNGVSDEDLCGWHHPEGGPMLVDELVEHARLLAERYGDRVDEWMTINEPMNLLVLAYGAGSHAPGRTLLFTDFDALIDAFRQLIAAHAAMYDAIVEADTVDADGDGHAAIIGFPKAVVYWLPARDNEPSDNPDDLAAVARIEQFWHYAFVDALIDGDFDADLDGTPDENHPEWIGRLDWLGINYYFTAGVTAEPALLPGLDLTVCALDVDSGACLPGDPTKFIPTMHYDWLEQGMYELLVDFGARYPDLPLIVAEAGAASDNERRKTEHMVRTIEQVWRAREAGVDIRGYHHWTLFDNFEWAEGFAPRFGLYHTDFDTYERTSTMASDVYSRIAHDRVLSGAQRAELGGTGPLTAEDGESTPQ